MDEHLTKALSDLTGLFTRLAGPLADELGKMAGDKAREYRTKNAIKIFQKIQKMLMDAGISPEPIPSRLFLPAIEAATVEDNDTLQDRWAALLANASHPERRDTILPSFVEILRELVPEEAKFLQKIHQRLVDPFSAEQHPRDKMFSLEGGTLIGSFENLCSIEAMGESTQRKMPENHIALMTDDLVRLGILNRPTMSRSIDPGFSGMIFPGNAMYFLTVYGLSFLKACEPPPRK